MTKERQGFFRPHGKGEQAYQSFVPTPLQQVEVAVDDEMRPLLQQAHQQIASLSQSEEAMRQEVEASVRLAWGVPEPSPFMFGMAPAAQERDERMLMDEKLLCEATAFGVERLHVLPLSGRLFKDIHYVMMQGEHNEKKYPGEFRHSPTWIGDVGDTLFTAPFVTPTGDDFLTAFADLENYINEEDNLDVLIKAALIHYQFEMLHPFIDGNGRLGRLITQLFLIDRGVLEAPLLRQSVFLNRHQFEYFTGLASVEYSGRYEKWIKLYVKALSAKTFAGTLSV